MIYIFIFILLVLLSYFYDYKRIERGKLVWLFVITLIFIMLGGLHYRLGLDNPAYERFYRSLHHITKLTYSDIEESRFAPGFVVFAALTKLVSPDLILLNFIQSTFVCTVVTWFFNKNTRNPFFALTLFFAFMFTLLIFEQIREAISVGFFLLAWPSFVKRKWWLWYLWSFCAIGFHTSATMMFVLPLIVLPGVKQIFIYGKRTLFLCLGVFVLGFVIQAAFIRYIEMISVTDTLQETVSRYEGTSFVKGNLNLMGMMTQIFKNILYPFLALFCVCSFKRNNAISPNLKNVEHFVILSLYVSLFSISVPIISRFNNYFFFFSILIMSDWVFSYIRLQNKKIRIRFVTWALLFLPLFTVQIYTSYMGNINKSGSFKAYLPYYPYTSYLDYKKDENREKLYKVMRRRGL